MAERVKIDGLRDLEKALAQLPKSTGKGVLRRVGKKELQPVADTAASMAPKADGNLKKSIAVSTKLSGRQGKLHRKMFRDDRASVEIFAGAGPIPSAHAQEFGTINHPAKPFMRPAWEAKKMAVLEGIKKGLWVEVKKSADRLARKAARLAGKR